MNAPDLEQIGEKDLLLMERTNRASGERLVRVLRWFRFYESFYTLHSAMVKFPEVEGRGQKEILCGGEVLALKPEESEPDENVKAVREMLLHRSRTGLLKYGVTTERKDLTALQWLQHLQEELLDAAVYVERLKREAGVMLITVHGSSEPSTDLGGP